MMSDAGGVILTRLFDVLARHESDKRRGAC